MEVLVDVGAGADVHKDSVTVCVMATDGRSVAKTLGRFPTFHDGLVEMRAWLLERGVTHVAMEATGEYWKPVYRVLEGAFELLVVNAQHVKNVPGRKTDPEDAAWLARLLRHGLLRPSFVPRPAVRDLRDLTRMRRKTIELSARVENRAQKVLEASGIKLGSVLSDVFGVTGRAILEQLAQDKNDPPVLAELAKGQLRKKKSKIVRALTGSFRTHDAALLRHQLLLHDELQERRAALETEIAIAASAYEELIVRLDAIPGINRDAAIAIIGEIGDDVSAWKSHRHIAAWSGLCPGNHESAGKRKKISVRKGNPFLKSLLVQAATSAVKTKGSYYHAKFVRISKRRGYKRAIVAIAHAMLIAIYHMIRNKETYREISVTVFEKRPRNATPEDLVRQLQTLGYTVEIRSA